MRTSIIQLCSILESTFHPPGPIVDFGSLLIPGQESFVALRSLFPGRCYIGCDIQQGPGVDLVADLHLLGLSSGSVGTALLLDTIEHVEHPRRAIREIFNALRKDGVLFITSVMNYPIHNYPNDYWRFTPSSFSSLLRYFPKQFVGYAGKSEFPHTIIGLGFKQAATDLGTFGAAFADWRRRWRFVDGQSWISWGKLIAPPAVHELYRKVRFGVPLEWD